MRGIASVLMVCVFSLPLVGGCNRTVSEKEKVTRHPDGTMSSDKRTVKEGYDGSKTVERETNTHNR